MRWALVVVDCLRYDARGAFDFSPLRRLDRVISVSNWTLPALATLVTGLHPLEHRAGCRPVRDNLVNSMKGWPSTLRGVTVPTILEEDSAVLYEIPVLGLAVEPPRPGHWRRCTGQHAHEAAWDHLDVSNLVVHVKGGHSPWRYVSRAYDLAPREIDHDDEELYLEELDGLAEELEPLVRRLADEFDNVVVCADHGRFFGDYVHPNHGNEMALDVLHVPVWYERARAGPIPDELYDSRAVVDVLSGEPPTSRQVTVSSSPGHGTYDRIALSYLAGGRLKCDVVETEEPFDLT